MFPKLFKTSIKPSQLSYINPKIELRKINRKESGLFAIKNIKKGEIITISVGLILPLNTIKKLPKNIQSFAYFVENGFFQVPFGLTNLTPDWFMNHSCNPNASAMKDKAKEAVTIKALQNIKQGEEIFYDYSEDYRYYKYKPFRKFRCRCDAKIAKKLFIIKWLPKNL